MSALPVTLASVAETIGGALHGPDAGWAGVSTDTRTLVRGELFVALRGPRFDGNAFVAEAAARGAAGAVVERHLGDLSLPQIVVPDAQAALARLAHAWRERCSATVVGITGSNGKTSVKEMTAAILGRSGPTLATRGNLNNDIGVPLTLLRIEPGHRYAVVEMGAGRVGDIARLCAIGAPDIGLITNAGPAHLEGFGDLDGVARGKGEMYSGLRAEGIAVINADSPYAGYWRGLAGSRRIVDFGIQMPAEVRAEGIAADWDAARERFVTRFWIALPGARIDIALPLAGRHNVANALAAAALAHALRIAPDTVREGLESVAAVKGRLNVLRGAGGRRVIDDTYNANPASLGAAIDALALCPGARWLALGDMAELGAAGVDFHRGVAAQARAAGVTGMACVGPLSRHAAEAFGAGARHFETQEALVDWLRQRVPAEATVLVKGSRSARMERVVEGLVNDAAAT